MLTLTLCDLTVKNLAVYVVNNMDTNRQNFIAFEQVCNGMYLLGINDGKTQTAMKRKLQAKQYF